MPACSILKCHAYFCYECVTQVFSILLYLVVTFLKIIPIKFTCKIIFKKMLVLLGIEEKLYGCTLKKIFPINFTCNKIEKIVALLSIE